MSAAQTRFIQLTDLHLSHTDRLLFDRIDPWQRFRTALVAASHFDPDAVLITGDIFDTDVPASPEFHDIVDNAGRELACPVLVLPGNHDDPETNLTRTVQAMATGPEPGDFVYHIADMRVVTLNTHGQGTLQGHVTEAQLTWLDTELHTPAQSGTVLAMHHPPTPTAHEFLSTVGLAHPHRLEVILNATDVRLILSGHLHYPTASLLGTVPVWSGPALAYQQNAHAPAGMLQGLDMPGISVIDFFPETHAIVPVPLETPTALFNRPIPQPTQQNTTQ